MGAWRDDVICSTFAGHWPARTGCLPGHDSASLKFMRNQRDHVNRSRAFPELLTPDEMARVDAAAPRLGAPGHTLMENAGRAVVRAIRARFRPCRTLVLCGPGNNGGDGYVVARLLAQEGWPVTVAALTEPRVGSDAARAHARWRGRNVPFAAEEAARAELVIDAVFGAGLSRDLDPGVIDVLRAARKVVAVDVPSGLDGTTGGVRGFAPKAVLTVTFFRLKPGHLLLPGRDLCGETVLADIGMPKGVLDQIEARAFRNGPGMWMLPDLATDTHKYERGHVTVLGGPEMTGAARLAAGAARRVGSGLVTIAALGSADVYRAGAPGILVSEAPVDDLLADRRRHVWVCGPGLGPEWARKFWPELVAAGRTIVGDADIFTAFAGNPEALRGAAVLTPHAGEFARAFGHLGIDRVAAVRGAAVRTGAVVLLKGADTIIARPDGIVAINDSAPPWLATAGAGDVLSGLIAGLLAQGMGAWEATLAGVWLHGRAAVEAGPGLIAEDLAPALPRAVAAASRKCAR
jgi:ADP-dependent NAD(P)H-hydrate dehydratase / NAD(P)H-hydrate epimerase